MREQTIPSNVEGKQILAISEQRRKMKNEKGKEKNRERERGWEVDIVREVRGKEG